MFFPAVNIVSANQNAASPTLGMSAAVQPITKGKKTQVPTLFGKNIQSFVIGTQLHKMVSLYLPGILL